MNKSPTLHGSRLHDVEHDVVFLHQPAGRSDLVSGSTLRDDRHASVSEEVATLPERAFRELGFVGEAVFVDQAGGEKWWLNRYLLLLFGFGVISGVKQP